MPTVELLDNLAPGEIPAYAALYYNNDCTGDYFNAEIDPVTLERHFNVMDLHGAGFHRNTLSVSVGSGFEVILHQNNYQGVKENLKGQGDSGEITCYQIKEGSEQKVASLEVFAMEGNSLQRWVDHYTGSDTAEALENDHP